MTTKTLVSKKKIILYNPKAVFYDMPLALISIGTAIQDLFDVIIVDGRLEENPLKIVEKYKDEIFLIGVTSLTGAPLKDAIQFTQKVKSILPNIPIVWGGWHVSLFPLEVLKEVEEVDVCVIGQGEESFRELCIALDQGNALNSVKGIAFRNNDVPEKTTPRPMVDMNELPRLNYDLIDVEQYFSKKGQRQFDFISSIGCFFRCTFCADPFVFQRKYNGLLPDRIVDDLEFFHKKYQFTDLNFQDETFFTYKDRIVEMAQRLEKLGRPFSWAATMRADQGSRMTFEELESCKKGGLRRLLIGVESGTQEMMDWLKKDIKIEQVLTCADWCKKLDLQVIFPFIVGFPNESQKSVEGTKSMISKLALMSPKFETPIFYFKPYPGTQITNEVVSKGEYVMPTSMKEWAEFDYVGSRGPWVDEEKFNFFEKYKFYLRLLRQKRKWYLRPLASIATRRVRRFNFKLPVEKWLIDRMKKAKTLS